MPGFWLVFCIFVYFLIALVSISAADCLTSPTCVEWDVELLSVTNVGA